MKRFVTSNLQLGRPNAIEIYDRPFKNVDEMTNKLIENWNSVVGKDDFVYHLGNFAWDPKTLQDAISKLNGTIWFIPGEHDIPLKELANKKMLLNNSRLEKEIIELDNMGIVFSYWPLKAWPKKNDGSWSIIGHPSQEYKSNPKQKTINISTDLWNFMPQELLRTLDIFKDL